MWLVCEGGELRGEGVVLKFVCWFCVLRGLCLVFEFLLFYLCYIDMSVYLFDGEVG